MKMNFPVFTVNTKPLVIEEEEFKSVADYGLLETEMEKARLELGETDEKIKTCLQELKKKLSKDEDVHYRTEDAYLLRFLRVKKFNSDKAYEQLKYYYNMRKTRPDFYNTPKNLKARLDSCSLKLLPYTDEEGKLLFWLDYGRWNPEEVAFEDEAGAGFMVHDVISMNPRCQVNGGIGIFDMKEFNRHHVKAVVKYNRMFTFFNLLQYSYPWRVKKMLIINTGQLTRAMYSVIRPILTKKIKSRVFLIGYDLSELHQHINPAILPKKLGGQLEDEECNVTTQLVLENLSYLEYDRSFK